MSKVQRVIVPDLINFGLSDTTEEPLNYLEDQGALFEEFIDTLGLEDITFIGHDWGGPIELSYAVDNPDNVKALAFFESFIVPFPDVSVVDAFPEEFVGAFWSDPELLEQNAIDNNLFIEGWLFDPAFSGIANPLTEAEKEVYREPFLDPEARDQLAISPEQLPFIDATGYPILDPDGPGGLPPEPVPNIEEYVEFANYLATTDVPKLLIYGNPGFASSELVVPLAESIPGFEVVGVGNEDNPAFHFLQEDVPEELSMVLGDWIDSTNETVEPSSEITLKITVENIAPENGIGFAALWFGLHDGSFDVFDPGETASKSLEFLFEDGLVGLEEEVLPGILDEIIAAGLDINQLPLSVQQAIALGLDLPNIPPPSGTLAGDFLTSPAGQNGGTQGMVVTSIRTNPELFDILDDPSAFPQEVLDSVTNPFFFIQASGETETFTVTLDGTPEDNRYFSFASMLFPTNDGFIGNEDPQAMEIFDESGNFIGADFIVTGADTWDGGTEVNDEAFESLLYTFEAFGDGVDENGTIQPYPGFLPSGDGGVLDFEFNGNLVAANADFTADGEDYPIARISVELVEEPVEEPEPLIIDFEDNNLAAGTIITDQYEGAEFSSSSEFGLMLFDSDNVTGQDFDLGATDLGKILIISEDGNSANPDDNAGGGTIAIEFDELTQVNSIGLLDIDEPGSSMTFYGEDDNIIDIVEIASVGDNGFQELTFEINNVASLDINFAGSGALTELDFTPAASDF